MDELIIEIKINTDNKLTADQRQAVLADIKEVVGKYLNNPPVSIGITNFRIFKHFTDEELANALINRK